MLSRPEHAIVPLLHGLFETVLVFAMMRDHQALVVGRFVPQDCVIKEGVENKLAVKFMAEISDGFGGGGGAKRVVIDKCKTFCGSAANIQREWDTGKSN